MSGLKIIYYHLVSDDIKKYFPPENTISRKVFVKHIKYINNKFEIITLDEAYQRYLNNEKFDKQVVITTDDGFKENYTNIADILADFKVKATFFINTSTIDNTSIMWRHALYILYYQFRDTNNKKLYDAIRKTCLIYSLRFPFSNESILDWSIKVIPNNLKEKIIDEIWNRVYGYSIKEFLHKNNIYLNNNELKTLLNEGFNIYSHSHSHPYFPSLSYEEITKELKISIEEIRKINNKNILAFSFPFGRCNKTTKIIMHEFNDIKIVLGTRAFTDINNRINPLHWDRINLEKGIFSFKIFLYLTPYYNRISSYVFNNYSSEK